MSEKTENQPSGPPSDSALGSGTPSQIISAEWQGPLPPPAVLERFNEIVPEGAERIFRMAEAEQKHRIEMEQRGLAAEISDTKRGQFLGTLIAAVALIAAAYCATIGAPWIVSVALVSIPIMGVVKAIIDRGSK